MQIYLPIAEMAVPIETILVLGGVTGVLSGMFGVGGGFIMTPLLIFLGIPPTVAVASSSNQIIAASVSGFVAHWRRRNVDFKMGTLLMLGGLVGSSAGVWLFSLLKKLGQIDLVISVSYVGFLGTIGFLMVLESVRAILHLRRQQIRPAAKDRLAWMQCLPFRVHFSHSQVTVSILVPLAIGLFVGVLVSIMGIGGGFLMIPAMIYILRMPTSVVIGTSLYQVIFVTANATFLHAVTTHTVDIVLAFLLLTGSVVGAQVGTRLGGKLRGEYLRGMLALLVVGVALKLGVSLFTPPDDPYEVVLERVE